MYESNNITKYIFILLLYTYIIMCDHPNPWPPSLKFYLKCWENHNQKEKYKISSSVHQCYAIMWHKKLQGVNVHATINVLIQPIYWSIKLIIFYGHTY